MQEMTNQAHEKKMNCDAEWKPQRSSKELGGEIMKCAACAIELKMDERSGIEIDYYPQCRGVWLDRGELHKIIERSDSTSM